MEQLQLAERNVDVALWIAANSVEQCGQLRNFVGFHSRDEGHYGMRHGDSVLHSGVEL